MRPSRPQLFSTHMCKKMVYTRITSLLGDQFIMSNGLARFLFSVHVYISRAGPVKKVVLLGCWTTIKALVGDPKVPNHVFLGADSKKRNTNVFYGRNKPKTRIFRFSESWPGFFFNEVSLARFFFSTLHVIHVRKFVSNTWAKNRTHFKLKCSFVTVIILQFQLILNVWQESAHSKVYRKHPSLGPP